MESLDNCSLCTNPSPSGLGRTPDGHHSVSKEPQPDGSWLFLVSREQSSISHWKKFCWSLQMFGRAGTRTPLEPGTGLDPEQRHHSQQCSSQKLGCWKLQFISPRKILKLGIINTTKGWIYEYHTKESFITQKGEEQGNCFVSLRVLKCNVSSALLLQCWAWNYATQIHIHVPIWTKLGIGNL